MKPSGLVSSGSTQGSEYRNEPRGSITWGTSLVAVDFMEKHFAAMSEGYI
jgi:hypothetical protein